METLTTVARLDDLPDGQLRRGQLGTIVERLARGVSEVEFSDDEGCAHASLALPAGKLIRLYHPPENR